MYISTKSIVSNSDMIKNYKACREKAQSAGKIFILKNNQPDAVLFSIDKYERMSVFIEYMESVEDKDTVKSIARLPGEMKRKAEFLDPVRNDMDDQPQNSGFKDS